MIVQCPDCESRFRLAEEKMKPGGTKIRCTRCGKIFTATAPEPSVPSEPLSPSEPQDSVREPDALPQQEDFSQSADFESAAGDEAFDTDFSDAGGADFDFGAFDDLATPGDGEFFGEEEQPSEDFAFDEPMSFEDEVDFAQGVNGGDQASLTSSEASPETEAPAEETEETFAFDTPSAVETENTGLYVQENPEFDPSMDNGGMFGAEELEQGVSESEPVSPPPGRPARRKSRSKGLALFLVLLLAGLAGGGYYLWKDGRLNSEWLSSLVTRATVADAPKGEIRAQDLKGGFVANVRSGQLFVITGRALNAYSDTRSTIMVKGVLYDDKGAVLLQQTAFCGNPLNKNELAAMPFKDIAARMNNQFGDSLSNMNIPPGKSIPFTIVFRDLPEGVSTFFVEVVDSEPGSR